MTDEIKNEGVDDKIVNSDTENQRLYEFKTLQEILSLMKSLNKQSIKRILKTVSTYYEIEDTFRGADENVESTLQNTRSRFSENRDVSAKDFMLEKNPLTDAEKVACLAYYLTYYRNQDEFKTLDISKLNTDAAQVKFANPTVAVDHATRHYNFLVATKKGYKKLSAIGELYIQALPDREEAKKVLAKSKPKNRKRKTKTTEKVTFPFKDGNKDN